MRMENRTQEYEGIQAHTEVLYTLLLYRRLANKTIEIFNRKIHYFVKKLSCSDTYLVYVFLKV